MLTVILFLVSMSAPGSVPPVDVSVDGVVAVAQTVDPEEKDRSLVNC